MIRLELAGEPIPQARPRMFRKGHRTMVFDPQAAYKKQQRYLIQDQIDNIKDFKQFRYPNIRFWFFMPIPKSMNKTDRLMANEERLRHIKKPDVDNITKLYLDILTGIVYDDDNCVALDSCRKIYSPNPRTVMFIDEGEKLYDGWY